MDWISSFVKTSVLLVPVQNGFWSFRWPQHWPEDDFHRDGPTQRKRNGRFGNGRRRHRVRGRESQYFHPTLDIFVGCFCHIFEAHFIVTFQICMNATCVNIRPFRDYLRCPVNRDSVECSGRGVSLKKPKISLLLGPASDGVRFQSVLALEFTKLRTPRKTLCFEL